MMTPGSIAQEMLTLIHQQPRVAAKLVTKNKNRYFGMPDWESMISDFLTLSSEPQGKLAIFFSCIRTALQSLNNLNDKDLDSFFDVPPGICPLNVTLLSAYAIHIANINRLFTATNDPLNYRPFLEKYNQYVSQIVTYKSWVFWEHRLLIALKQEHIALHLAIRQGDAVKTKSIIDDPTVDLAEKVNGLTARELALAENLHSYVRMMDIRNTDISSLFIANEMLTLINTYSHTALALNITPAQCEKLITMIDHLKNFEIVHTARLHKTHFASNPALPPEDTLEYTQIHLNLYLKLLKEEVHDNPWPHTELENLFLTLHKTLKLMHNFEQTDSNIRPMDLCLFVAVSAYIAQVISPLGKDEAYNRDTFLKLYNRAVKPPSLLRLNEFIHWENRIYCAFGYITPYTAAPGCGPAESIWELVKTGDVDRVKTMLSQGSHIQSRDDTNSTLLHIAASSQQTAIITMLLKHPNINTIINALDSLNRSPLFLAVWHKNPCLTIIQQLLLAGAQPNISDAATRTPLYIANAFHASAAVKLLLAHGAQPAASDIVHVSKVGLTFLHQAVLHKETALTLKIAQLTTDINKRTTDGFSNTALHIAVDRNCTEIVSILLRHPDTDLTLKNANGFTPMDIAGLTRNQPIIALLRAHLSEKTVMRPKAQKPK